MRQTSTLSSISTSAVLVFVLACAGCENGGRTQGVFGGSNAAAPPQDIWAVRCLSIAGSDRMRLISGYAELLKKVSGLDPQLVQVFHEENDSRLYYGRYKRSAGLPGQDDRFTPDPRADIDLIRTLSLERNGEPMWPFRLATIEPLPTSRSQHPEWQLRNATGYWSMHVGVFYDTGEMRQRREAAEEYCALLRKQGYEAYFDHGPVNSSVTVGAFPKEAIQDVREIDPLTGIPRFVNRIVDPQMLKLQDEFGFSLENGHKIYEIERDPRTGKITQRNPIRPFPVIIPHAGGDAELGG